MRYCEYKASTNVDVSGIRLYIDQRTSSAKLAVHVVPGNRSAHGYMGSRDDVRFSKPSCSVILKSGRKCPGAEVVTCHNRRACPLGRNGRLPCSTHRAEQSPTREYGRSSLFTNVTHSSPFNAHASDGRRTVRAVRFHAFYY
jgi:hypothetical protein